MNGTFNFTYMFANGWLPATEDLPYRGTAAGGGYSTVGDLFRQIGHDERVHKDESVARMAEPRFR